MKFFFQKNSMKNSMNPDDCIKIAVATAFRLFEYIIMLFDLKNAAQTFQRYID